MNIESTREYCISMPHSTEVVQWGANLCFKVGGKIFAVMSLEPSSRVLSFKCSPESFLELQEIDGIIPAPYMARAHWVALERWDALRDDELRGLLRTAYELVFAKLTRKVQEELHSGRAAAAKKHPKKRPARKSVAKNANTKRRKSGTSQGAAKRKR